MGVEWDEGGLWDGGEGRGLELPTPRPPVWSVGCLGCQGSEQGFSPHSHLPCLEEMFLPLASPMPPTPWTSDLSFLRGVLSSPLNLVFQFFSEARFLGLHYLSPLVNAGLPLFYQQIAFDKVRTRLEG